MMSEQNFKTFDQEDDDLDIARLIRYIFMQSKMILFITFAVFLLSLAWFITSTKSYKISSLLQVESFNQGSLDPTDTLQMMSPYRSSADLDNLVNLYKSRTNILKMIEDLSLNIEINEITNEEEVNIKFFHNDSDIPYSYDFYILPQDNSVKVFSDNGEDFLIEANHGELVSIFNEFSFRVDSVNLKNNRLIRIAYKNPVSLYTKYKNGIRLDANTGTSFVKTDEGLIQISLISSDIEEAKSVINYSNKIFLDQRVFAETEKSRAAINFIDKNLLGMQKIVFQNKEKLNEFREKNKSINLELETKVIIDTIESIDSALYEIEVELADASKIYTITNPIYINLINKKEILIRQKNDVLSEIAVMPKEQQEYIDLFNQVEITQKLLEELESRRLGFSILEASTIGDIRIIDKAYVETKVSPQLLFVVVSSMLAFLFSVMLALIRGANYLPLTNPAEISDYYISEPLIGVLPYDDDINNISHSSEYNKYGSAIQSCVVNIKSLQESAGNDSKVFSLSSATPLNGKSTTSKNLAEAISAMGSKVLLIDADYKRGSLAKEFGVRSMSEETFNEINSSNLEKLRVSENLYLIPRVKGLINSFHFVCSPAYSKFLKDMRSQFDFIIFDTAPILSVADTSVIVKQADINILVVRHEVNKIGEVKQSLDMYSKVNAACNGFIYNAYAKPTGYYGYYGLYGNYSYTYYTEKYLNDSYDYKKED